MRTRFRASRVRLSWILTSALTVAGCVSGTPVTPTVPPSNQTPSNQQPDLAKEILPGTQAGDPSPAGDTTPTPSPTDAGGLVTDSPAPTATPTTNSGGGGGGGTSSGGGGGTSTSTPTPTPKASASPTPTPTPSPSASASVAASPTPTPTPTPTPSSTASAAATPAPSALPTANPTPQPAPVANPGPSAARGRVLLNGQGAAGLTIKLYGPTNVTTTTDAQGYFNASGLADGDYYAYYYNSSDRNKIGYWRSATQHVDTTTGAAYPAIDFYQVGMMNDPAMDSHITLPYTFRWVPQTQTVVTYHFRVHSTNYTNFTLVYQSSTIPGDATSYTWDGSNLQAGQSISDPTHRFFWGVSWDAGPLGQGGNLYQSVYFQQ